MNKLYGTRVYLMGSIQYSDGRLWREEATIRLNKIGIKCFNPYNKPFINEIKEDEEARAEMANQLANGEFDKVSQRMKQIRNDDLRLCDICDFGLFYINPKVASWGTAEELTTINREKKPIFIVMEGGVKATPFWILGMIKHKYIYSTLDEALTTIEDIDCGKIEIDSDRWHLLKEEYR